MKNWGTILLLEVVRRAGFYFLLALSAALFMWIDTSPLLRISEFDAEKRWKYDNVPVINVQGPVWEDLFLKCNDSFTKDRVVKGWEKRVDGWYREGWSLDSLWFRPTEKPFDSLQSRLAVGNSYLLYLADTSQYLELYYQAVEPPDIGSGMGNYPSAFVYPYRQYTLYVAACALLWYVLYPWPRKEPGAIRVKRGMIVVSDVAGAIMFGVFFGLPLLIVGSTQGAFGEWIFFSAFFWLLAALGLLMAYWSAWYASYSVHIENSTVIIQSLKGRQTINAQDLDECQRVRLRPPRWLVRLLWLGALSGRSTRTAGQAMILGSSSQDGIVLRTRDGKQSYVWMTDSMGREALENGEKLMQFVSSHGITCKDEPLEIRAFFPPH